MNATFKVLSSLLQHLWMLLDILERQGKICLKKIWNIGCLDNNKRTRMIAAQAKLHKSWLCYAVWDKIRYEDSYAILALAVYHGFLHKGWFLMMCWKESQWKISHSNREALTCAWKQCKSWDTSSLGLLSWASMQSKILLWATFVKRDSKHLFALGIRVWLC